MSLLELVYDRTAEARGNPWVPFSIVLEYVWIGASEPRSVQLIFLVDPVRRNLVRRFVSLDPTIDLIHPIDDRWARSAKTVVHAGHHNQADVVDRGGIALQDFFVVFNCTKWGQRHVTPAIEQQQFTAALAEGREIWIGGIQRLFAIHAAETRCIPRITFAGVLRDFGIGADRS